MPPPVPFVTRRHILEQEERPVPKQPAVVAERPQRTLEAIARRLSQARATGQRAEAERLEDEFYRKLVTHYTNTDVMPGSAQEKYEMLRDLIQNWRDAGARGATFYNALEQEYRHAFERVSFELNDPAQQVAVDLGLQG